VRLITHDVGGLSARDVELARQISAAARDLGVTADPSEDLEDPRGSGPSVWFQEVDELKPGRNRFHLDVSVPDDQGEARVAAAVAAGGRVVSDENAPQWWTLADADGNEADVATMLGRE
jgi:4a-hydroxytetrahydrobiopterin dehydratase